MTQVLTIQMFFFVVQMTTILHRYILLQNIHQREEGGNKKDRKTFKKPQKYLDQDKLYAKQKYQTPIDTETKEAMSKRALELSILTPHLVPSMGD
ncbi:hypothetical protein BOTCAL_0506g00050 [Botryotinia calthae]|uniref:Uncharacterized protein n=1 Tax=Botryotinia calthae TaxID=38488 RepID=A0A4Y8CP12_9HELO|nr:hypothetical protein BOTCAL_0506g00050 [Botryotinia calthae]